MTKPVLSNWGSGAFKQIADAAGNNQEFWQFAPGGSIEQLRQLVDPELVLDQYHPGGVLNQICDAISDGPPAPLALLDFDNETYTVGVTSYVVTDLLGADAEPGSTFDTDDIIPDSGLRGQNNGGSSAPSAIGPLLAVIIGSVGSTVVFDYEITSGSNVELFGFDLFNSPTWDNDVYLASSIATGQFFGDVQFVAGNEDTDIALAAYSSGHHRVAINFAASAAKFSMDGGSVVSAMPTEDPGWAGLNKAYMHAIGADYIHSIAVYEIQDDSGLTALSALS